ncbi:TIGR01777 family oxidoreductase [Oceanobacillus manasiensis]|uniref:TIGR01777 family oxidoreductase n=1 Tax=Oceanobacillus manasiensis TaxID=586413 RepID=UPI0005A866E0|nr:TIGR01777 family oxidoreductase [Oceanobacillus manasiensis]
MDILITGGTGFVGKHLTKALHENGHHTYILTRSPENKQNTDSATFIGYDHDVTLLPHIQAVINLAGESLFGYWSKNKKQSILESRIEITQSLVEMMSKMDTKPDVFISGSAVGYFGSSEDKIFTEATNEAGCDFLAEVALEWETVARQVEDQLNIRTVYLRFGVILGNEGAFPLMRLPVKLFAGGKIGSGEQWLSWIHIHDVVRLVQFCLNEKTIQGPVNATAPNPKRNKDFMRIVASVMHRPYWFPVPSSMIHLVIGEMAQLITKGQYVLPKKAQTHGFQFSYPHLREAINEIEE